MTEGESFRLFSVDDHIVEPAGVWADRVPAKYRETAPHVVEENGREFWEYEGTRTLTMGLNAVAGKPQHQWDTEPARFSDMIAGCYDPFERTKDMQSNGIFASVSFPTLPGFGGRLFSQFSDQALAQACIRSWNDFVLDEWCAAWPGQFVPMVITDLVDPVAGAVELRRCLDKGAKALCFVEEGFQLGLPSFWSDHYDPILALAEEAAVPVCMHIGSSGVMSPQPADAPYTVTIATAFTAAANAAVNMSMCPIPRKFPALKLVWSEGGIGWVPAAFERADRQYLRHRSWGGGDDLLPSEVSRRNMWYCMIEEPIGLSYRNDVGVEHIVWESDYPHADTPWPHTQKAVAEQFLGVDDKTTEAITHGTAEALFKWSMAELMPGVEVQTP